MADDPLTGTPPLHLWALLDAHLLCAVTCQATAQGWLIDGVSITASNAAAEHNGVSGTRCWCCGTEYPEAELVRLGQHPEVGVCLECARWLQQRAVQR